MLEGKKLEVISGAQTGADRAGLDAAIDAGLPHGGYCPRGGLSEDNAPILELYNLEETKSKDYKVRTRLNVETSDGTLVINQGKMTRGTKLTVELAEELDKPVFIVDVGNPPSLETFMNWLNEHRIERLNVAGPRESKAPGIYERATQILGAYFRAFNPEPCDE